MGQMYSLINCSNCTKMLFILTNQTIFEKCINDNYRLEWTMKALNPYFRY